jgi:RNA-splicing ligase RtcB
MIPLEYRGEHAACKVFTDRLDPHTVQQIYGFLNSPAFEGSPIRIMPDVHAGKGAVIGFTSPLNDKVIPNVIGVDIGCGVTAVPLTGVSKGEVDFQSFDDHLREHVPAGFKVRATVNKRLGRLFKQHISDREPWEDFEQAVTDLAVKIGDDVGRTWLSCGSLGGGNHFIEIGRDEESHDLWLVVHSGSRHFGLATAEYHQKVASDRMGPRGGLAWLEGAEAQAYLRDMRLAQKFAALSRVAMLDAMVDYFDLPLDGVVESVHNFIGDDDVIRKGAISAAEGEKVIIPWNMRDGMILGTGLGNPDWNNSAPHGAGRTMSRGQARRSLSVDDFREGMKKAGVWSSCVWKDTIDEAPGAYKEPESITSFLSDTVAITAQLKPIYNFKAGRKA